MTQFFCSSGPVLPKLTEIEEQKRECKALYFGDARREKRCLLQGSVDNPHVPLAISAFVMQHGLVALGFCRAHSLRIRPLQLALHSHFGYCCWLLGAVSSIVAGVKANEDGCTGILVLSLLFLITPFIFSAAGRNNLKIYRYVNKIVAPL